MARMRLDDVLSRWFHPVEEFETSALEFYGKVEAAVGRRQMPGVKFWRLDYKEGGSLSVNREYLRVSRERLNFDICAAPFGTGYFFSWWLTERHHRYAVILAPFLLVGLWLLTGFQFLAVVLLWPVQLLFQLIHHFVFLGIGVAYPLLVMRLLAVLILFFLIGRFGGGLLEDAVAGTPILGALYTRLFRRVTYYRIDSIQAFQSGVHGAVMETLDAVLSDKGVRALTEGEKKPILRDFLQR